MSASSAEGVFVDPGVLSRWVRQALERVDVVPESAGHVARGLVGTSLRGVDSHGIRLLPHYVAAVRGGRINPNPSFRFEQTSPGTGLLDADHGFGHAAGMVAMQRAMALAKENGSGWVVVSHSSHCGSLASYALEACARDMMGLALTHATPRVRAADGIRPFFGTNPLCFAAPMEGEGPFCYDAATSVLTSNRLRMIQAAGGTLQPGQGADGDGEETLDPRQVTQLLAIGGYKGFGLSMVVDILCGVLSGMPCGADVSLMYGNALSERRFLGQVYAALRVDAFMEVDLFKRRLKALAEAVRQEPPRDPLHPVMVPGDPEKRAQAERLSRGIPVPFDLYRQLQALAGQGGVR